MENACLRLCVHSFRHVFPSSHDSMGWVISGMNDRRIHVALTMANSTGGFRRGELGSGLQRVTF